MGLWHRQTETNKKRVVRVVCSPKNTPTRRPQADLPLLLLCLPFATQLKDLPNNKSVAQWSKRVGEQAQTRKNKKRNMKKIHSRNIKLLFCIAIL